MARTSGAKNIQKFEDRTKVSSTSSKEIKHLAQSSKSSALDQFKALLKHQKNYLNWLESRHNALNDARIELAQLKSENYRGPKGDTYRKYKWYAEHNALLEAINGFEVFYKTTLINLAKIIRHYVPAEKLSGAVDVKVLWGLTKASVPELVFEHQLYHDLDNVDKVCFALVGSKRYNKNNPKSNLRELNLALQAIFQVRHTLSHNHGVITISDKSKLKILGYDATTKEVIDPSKDGLGSSITRLLEQESKDFTLWLLDKTADYLKEQVDARGLELDKKIHTRLQKLLGNNQKLDNLDWV